MIRRTARAASQVATLLAHYYEHDRPEAAGHLIDALQEALLKIEQDPSSGMTHPRPYPDIAKRGFRWIKVHRYWFGYCVIDHRPVLTNVLYDAADMPSRVKDLDRVLPDEDGEASG